MNLDWNISVGNILTALGLLIGFYIAHVQNVRKLQDIDTKVKLIYDWFRHRIMNSNREGVE